MNIWYGENKQLKDFFTVMTATGAAIYIKLQEAWVFVKGLMGEFSIVIAFFVLLLTLMIKYREWRHGRPE